LRCRYPGMAEEFLYCSQVGSSAQGMGGEGVTVMLRVT
jgi:hypothetical protein